jgi:hypothetical protein
VAKDQVISAQCEKIVMARMENPLRVENGLVEPNPQSNMKAWREEMAAWQEKMDAETVAIRAETEALREEMAVMRYKWVNDNRDEMLACQEMEARLEEEKPVSVCTKPAAAQQEKVPLVIPAGELEEKNDFDYSERDDGLPRDGDTSRRKRADLSGQET